MPFVGEDNTVEKFNMRGSDDKVVTCTGYPISHVTCLRSDILKPYISVMPGGTEMTPVPGTILKLI
jgi:hypothetical protein